MNPGYGALNAAGNRCYMLVALAKKLGVEHPEIDLAVERGTKFFRSYYEKGAVPYGHHGAAASDDSNGKNVGVAFALKLLDDKQGAQILRADVHPCLLHPTRRARQRLLLALLALGRDAAGTEGNNRHAS